MGSRPISRGNYLNIGLLRSPKNHRGNETIYGSQFLKHGGKKFQKAKAQWQIGR